jgi:hypothetical protein
VRAISHAWRKFAASATRRDARSFASIPGGTQPDSTWIRGQLSVDARCSACSMLATNSASRPGSEARPRSPAARSPGGALITTHSRPWRASRAAISFGGTSYANANSTAEKSACAAAAKRSRNGTSLNRKLRLADSRGMREHSVADARCG